MNHIKKHGGIHTLNKGGMYDAIMKFMGGGNMEYMQEGGKPDFLDLDKDGNKTESMKSAAASAKEMGKGGRMYRMGGVNEMDHGGGLKVLIKAMQEGGMLNMMGHGGVHNNEGEVDTSSPEFKEYLEYRMKGSGQPLYFKEYKGDRLSPTELRQMIREQGSAVAIPRSLMPENVSDRFMNEPMIGFSSGPGGARANMGDAMSGAEAMFNQNRKFEQEFLEFMRGQGGAAPRREPGMRLEQSPEGELTNAERRLLDSFNR